MNSQVLASSKKKTATTVSHESSNLFQRYIKVIIDESMVDDGTYYRFRLSGYLLKMLMTDGKENLNIHPIHYKDISCS